MAKKSEPSDRKIQRREFLKLSVAGTAATLVGANSNAQSIDGQRNAGANSAQSARNSTAPNVPDSLPFPQALAGESWQEPWVWRPDEWPDIRLDLNVVLRQSPGPSPSPGSTATSLFSYNGANPGQTIRLKNTGQIDLTIRNMLGLNLQRTPVGYGPDANELPMALNHEICNLVEEQRRGLPLPNGQLCVPFFPGRNVQCCQAGIARWLVLKRPHQRTARRPRDQPAYSWSACAPGGQCRWQPTSPRLQ